MCRRGWEYGMVGGAKFWAPNYNVVGFFAMFAVGALAAGVQVRIAALRSILFDILALVGVALAAWSLWEHFPDSRRLRLPQHPLRLPVVPAGRRARARRRAVVAC